MNRSKIFAAALMAAAFLLGLAVSGCTELERNGMSHIPQNSPGSWEMRPYGDIRN